MARFVIRQDLVEFTGRVVLVSPPLLPSSDASIVHNWTVLIKPDPPHAALLTTRNGITNIGGTITCTVAVDDTLVSWSMLLPLLSNTYNRKVRVVGTWCDDDDNTSTVILPLGLLAAEYDLEIYDINGWPVAVRDVDLIVFAHASPNILGLGEPHAGESRTLTIQIPFPLRPSSKAAPFARAYLSTRVDLANTVSFSTINGASPLPVLRATVETGTPADGKGFFAVQLGLTFDEPELDKLSQIQPQTT